MDEGGEYLRELTFFVIICKGWNVDSGKQTR